MQVGNCVAKRNYRYFYLFLNTVMVMAIYVMGCNIAVIVLGTIQLYSSTVVHVQWCIICKYACVLQWCINIPLIFMCTKVKQFGIIM